MKQESVSNELPSHKRVAAQRNDEGETLSLKHSVPRTALTFDAKVDAETRGGSEEERQTEDVNHNWKADVSLPGLY
jgi:hypothetical protein